MNTKRITLLATALLTATVLAGGLPATAAGFAWLGGERVQGSGQIVSQARQPGAFRGVSLSVPGKVEVRTGGDDTLTIEGDDNIVPLVETVVERDVLVIRPVRKNLNIDGRKLKIVVQARDVNRLSVAGSGSMDAQRVRADRLSLDVAGSGVLDVSGIEAKAVDIEVAGSGKVHAAGQAQKTEISIAGSGKADATRLASQNVSASVAGSGQALLTARQAISANVAGSGNVSYYGDAQVTKSIAGSGTVKRLGGAAE